MGVRVAVKRGGAEPAQVFFTGAFVSCQRGLSPLAVGQARLVAVIGMG
jgi:hypothetical protein